MTKEKTFTLTLTKSQLRLIADAVEDWSRFLSGQCEMNHAVSMLDNEHYRKATNYLQTIVQPQIVPMLGDTRCSYSWDGGNCPNENQRKAIAMSYGIYREILHYFATHPKRTDWSCYVSETLRCDEQGPLIKIEEVD